MTNDTSTSATAACGLYLVLPDGWTEPDFLKNLKDLFRAINASSHEKNNHVIELRVEEPGAALTDERKEIIGAMCALTQSQGLVFMVGGDIALAQSINADGVLVETLDDLARAKSVLGEEKIIGMRCGTSRRMAEAALAAGADYVSFHDALAQFLNPAIVQWWQYKSDNPCLVEGRYTNDDCAFYVNAGAGFIECGDYVWSHPEGVMKGIVNMMYAIDLAAGEEEQKAPLS